MAKRWDALSTEDSDPLVVPTAPNLQAAKCSPDNIGSQEPCAKAPAIPASRTTCKRGPSQRWRCSHWRWPRELLLGSGLVTGGRSQQVSCASGPRQTRTAPAAKMPWSTSYVGLSQCPPEHPGPSSTSPRRSQVSREARAMMSRVSV